jgi:ribosomal protein L17
MALRVQFDRITPGHTEQNGGYERMRRSMKKEPQGQTGGMLGGT